ncbi:hypothetical protein AYO21_06708 [Fonsecaea monophora]|uniref:Calponin-homology (CH) domain-containing protein n=1 Tax=Fonsecaea monophora TaxID=254056 RepID=A0A177F428_9EURO|nr:hypothetical protein AYO21_06708 [Fonsecaea monophora]OAG38988.1 hypothetical protein AYO21_06708 [Fonsecaea monophora]
MLPPLSAATGTPCPIPLLAGVQVQKQQQHRHEQHLRQLDLQSVSLSPTNDTTANIEFTSAFAAPAPSVLKSVKPRRRRPHDGQGFTIHEDKASFAASRSGERRERNGTSGDGIANEDNLLKVGARRAAISQPPQRPKKRAAMDVPCTAPIPPTTASAGDVVVQPQVRKQSGTSTRLSQAARRPITNNAERASSSSKAQPLPTLPEDTFALPRMDPTTSLKPDRRTTIYIPTEDTTVPSMYMGIFSPIKRLGPAVKPSPGWPATSATAELPSKPDVELTGIVAQMVAKKRGAARSKSTMSPTRRPLQVTTNPLQESAVLVDRWGQGGGKENIPPGQNEMLGMKATSGKGRQKLERRSSDLEDAYTVARQQQVKTQARVLSKGEPTAIVPRKARTESPAEGASTKPGCDRGPQLKPRRPGRASVIGNLEPKSNIAALKRESIARKLSVPSRFVIPKVNPIPACELYPVITEDLVDPMMYEENWLSHQETAITQLVNTLFAASTALCSPVEDEMLRLRLLERYGDPENVLLYKRLQAALLYGALSVPRDVLRGSLRLSTDIGKRKAFTNLWLDTYELASLGSALEVVVGRRCLSNGTESSTVCPVTENSHSVNRRTLQQFIETFLIRNEDGHPDEPSTDHSSWSYQRTLLRSLMLIKLLDMMKTTPNPVSSMCLFQPSASYKASVSVVKALFQQLNPSAGDPIRALTHIGYVVMHTQHPLAEYTYQMENLAIDLRDGVRLTRLVEILLYPSASPSLEYVQGSDSTSSITLPDGQQMPLNAGDSSLPLSQHLKYPCLGRATKLYNVQIALSAIQGVKGVGDLAEAVKAEDIVDGFREKTVRLLWGLTSKWGLGGLVDWNDVEREIKRLCRTGASSHVNDYFDLLPDEDDHARYTTLLKAWAQAVGSKQGIRVTNLTTNFADGRVFGAIVDEYEGYLGYDVGSPKGRSLAERLRCLGCSEQFAMLFTQLEGSTHRAPIFTRDFVVAALAFLCSRLLNPTKGVRAAVAIQRRWRSHWARVVESRKVHMKSVAESCAAMALQRGAASAAKQRENEVGQPLAGDEDMEQADGDIWLSL